MATYKCRRFGIVTNDTMFSKMATPKKCNPENTSATISEYAWSEISETN
ncbi:hypothetical protein [Lacinutrix sp.]|nr:hypothetical protein [Lacinutrix sp.]